MELKAKIKVTKYEKRFSGPDKPIENDVVGKELVLVENSIIGSDGNLLVNKEDAIMGMYIIVDKISPEEIELTAYGFPNQSNSDLVSLEENKKEQHFNISRFQQRSLNIPLLGGSDSLTILFLGTEKDNQSKDNHV